MIKCCNDCMFMKTNMYSAPCNTCVNIGRGPNNMFVAKIINDSDIKREINETAEGVAKLDAINHPSHYTDGKIEVIDYIEDKKLNYHLGNVVKYVSRAGKKDPEKYVEDLKKAAWYLDREIKERGGDNE